MFSAGYSLRSGFPHSDISGSTLHCQLPRAYRRLVRPSSPVIAKASTTCTCSLDPETPLFVCMRFQDLFTPLPGFFSPFPHGTGALSVDYEYLALEDGPPMFRQDFSCPALLVASSVPRSGFRVRGCQHIHNIFMVVLVVRRRLRAEGFHRQLRINGSTYSSLAPICI